MLKSTTAGRLLRITLLALALGALALASMAVDAPKAAAASSEATAHECQFVVFYLPTPDGFHRIRHAVIYIQAQTP